LCLKYSPEIGRAVWWRMNEHDEAPPGRAERLLIRRAVKASLATIGAAAHLETEGWPAAALVTVAASADASPILLLSTLSHHTRNLMADDRAALLIDATEGFGNPQAGPRVTLVGRVRRDDDPALRRRFLARHPAAQVYAGFGDFAVYRMNVERLHSVGGFARAIWIEAKEAMLDPGACAEVATHEEDVLKHLNGDHPDTVALYATKLAGVRGKRFVAVGSDPDGLDIRGGRRLIRVDFSAPHYGLDSLRRAFVKMAQDARSV
jgi:putative heme iron utilization protein